MVLILLTGSIDEHPGTQAILTVPDNDDNWDPMLYWIRYLWVATRGYRLRPWRSPYLRWRIETFSGIHADAIDIKTFWKFMWSYRKELAAFLRWSAEMQRSHGMK